MGEDDQEEWDLAQYRQEDSDEEERAGESNAGEADEVEVTEAVSVLSVNGQSETVGEGAATQDG